MKNCRALYIPCVKGFSEKFRCIANQYNIRPIFLTKQALSSVLMKTRRKKKNKNTEKTKLQNVYIAFHANMADVTLEKQEDHYPCGSANIGTT
jgi:hypothetical protein